MNFVHITIHRQATATPNTRRPMQTNYNLLKTRITLCPTQTNLIYFTGLLSEARQTDSALNDFANWILTHSTISPDFILSNIKPQIKNPYSKQLPSLETPPLHQCNTSQSLFLYQMPTTQPLIYNYHLIKLRPLPTNQSSQPLAEIQRYNAHTHLLRLVNLSSL